MMHRMLTYGGRDYADATTLAAVLASLRTSFGDFVLINGGARGADRLAKEWGHAQGLPVITMDAAWTALGKRAGFVRNQWMLDHATPTYAVEFPGGAGTADMRTRCLKAGLTVWTPLSN